MSQKTICASLSSFVLSHREKILSAQAFNLLPSKSGSIGLISRWSSASFLPSLVILSILSVEGSTAPLRTFSALSASPVRISFCCPDGFVRTLCRSTSGTSKSKTSAVLMSAISLNVLINSGKLKNLANLVFALYPLPSGESSSAVTVSPKVEAQASKLLNPNSASLLYCKYLCIVYNSVIELLIGVPVANTTPLPSVISSR